jgi:elongation factor Ts
MLKMTVNAKEVQELRKMSGAGMMECKNALTDSGGDINQAFKILREKGIAKAEKKSSRDANEGLIGVKVEKESAVIIEVNSETDFVSRNSEFHELVNSIMDIYINEEDNLLLEDNKNVTELVNAAVGKIGENIVLKRSCKLNGNIYSYVHNSVSDGLGKIGVLLNLESDSDKITEIGKNICMHIAALRPKSISVEDLDTEIVNSEKEIIKQQLKDSGKPDNILEKMMDGKLKKFYEENTLMGQKFVMDPTITVAQYINQYSEKYKSKISIKQFIRYEIGS